MHLQIPGLDGPTQPSKVLCIGRNYARHVEEMKSEMPSEPVVFLKPPSSLVGPGGAIEIPSLSKDVHHEVELVVAISKPGKHILPADAMDWIAGYAVGLDMTARDIQSIAKSKGTPWSVAKGFDTFAPVGVFSPRTSVPNAQNLSIRLTVNGRKRQDGTTAHMLFQIPELVAYCSSIFTLHEGDLLYTGTPAGVGPVLPGDSLIAEISGLTPLEIGVVAEGS